MPCIDFKEIPAANKASGDQDRFELFARDFFTEIFKFQVLSEPSRGADGGKDILFAEQQTGTLSNGTIKWLVSCKHKAFSGSSVSPDDESNISDRIEQFGADGFIGFYSTLPRSGLNNRLDSYKNRFKIQVFDKERIESYILGHKRYELFKRYFPKSYQEWMVNENEKTPSQILSSYMPLKCSVWHRFVSANTYRSWHYWICHAAKNEQMFLLLCSLPWRLRLYNGILLRLKGYLHRLE